MLVIVPMKRILYISIFIICCILISCGYVWATGATANIVKYRQPDGSIISLKMFGDEFFAYSTTLDGYIVAIGNDGYCYYANYDSGYLKLSGNRVAGSSVKSSGSLFFANPFIKMPPYWNHHSVIRCTFYYFFYRSQPIELYYNFYQIARLFVILSTCFLVFPSLQSTQPSVIL